MSHCLDTLVLARVQAYALRYPISTPVRTSFGVMADRPAVLVCVEDQHGMRGWGEAWCNFPACGAEHRANIINTVLAPRLAGQSFQDAAHVFRYLTQTTAVLALQANEPGPFAQAIAGIDLAVWDLLARRQGKPLWQLLGGHAGVVPVYASGINPESPMTMLARKRGEGYRAFKLKVGFGAEQDIRNLQTMRDALAPGERLMADANQAWDVSTALEMCAALERFDLDWLEEPLRADRPWSEWQTLCQRGKTPLAAGENVYGEQGFAALMDSRAIAVVQPDIAKWGGISATLAVIRTARARGLRYCPHFLGAGIGLLHSAHLLAAAGGDGLLEIDANDNMLRTALGGPSNTVVEGWIDLGDAAGIGVEPNIETLRALCAV